MVFGAVSPVRNAALCMESIIMTDLTAKQRELVQIYEDVRGQSCTEKDIPFIISALPHQIDKAIMRLKALQELKDAKCTVNKAVAISGMKRAAFYNFKSRWKNDGAITAALPFSGKKCRSVSTGPKYLEAQKNAERIETENPEVKPGKLAYLLSEESDISYDTALRYLRKARERRTGKPQHPTRREKAEINQKAWDAVKIMEKQNPCLSLLRVAEQIKSKIGDGLHIQTVYLYARRARELRTGKPIKPIQ